MNSFIYLPVFPVAMAVDAVWGDRLLGRWHPVRGIGRLIGFLDNLLYRDKRTPLQLLVTGSLLTLMVTAVVFGLTLLLEKMVAAAGWPLYLLFALLLTYWLTACGGLAAAAREVAAALAKDNLEEARVALALIVGRETGKLNREEIIRAVIETVAENLSDGVIAPVFYFLVGGLPLAWLYKAVNTMDSMIGYKNPRYLYFGRAAARLDDLANLIPARISALLIVAAAYCQGLDWRGAWRIMLRDRRAHRSPNSGWPEAAMAGALGLRLGGSHHYHGKLVEKPFIGDDRYPATLLELSRAVANLYLCAMFFYALVLLAMLINLGLAR
ncbi:MAG: cobalamin biosynthesis protein CobD [Deltaproteobacteria bacterium]|nr:cobalamin biosynthesis protein CobD [Deltaproteobacteria bacterium]